VKVHASGFVDLRGMRHHVLTWGDAAAPKLFLLHGWMDVGASFQFLVDALAGEWFVVAPDLRGFGRSQWQPQGYWFQDYVADLEALLDAFAPAEAVNLAGHSLGGNIAMQYAGVRPQRVRSLVSLDGFGIPAEPPQLALRKWERWLDALRDPPGWKPYPSLAAVADRLQRNNPRLARGRALFLARHWAEELPDGTARLVSDPRHRLPFPTVYRMEETAAVWRNIAAPTLWIAAAETDVLRWLRGGAEAAAGADAFDVVRERLAFIRGARLEFVADASHMLHHDQPAAVARLVEPFFASA
jgi:pimeloyl-ACP methyl ester carboxylesterase